MNSTAITEVISVGTYAERLNSALRGAGPAVVEGEVQETKALGRGVVSFTLTDGMAKLPCKWLPWGNGGRPLTHNPCNGDQVRVAVTHAEWWAEGGRANIVVGDIRLTGEGELLAARQQLLAKLQAEGLADPDSFPPLPRFPSAVGLIAGVDSDAYHDVIRGLRDRFPAVPVLTCCCRVQGAGAPQAMIDALATLSHHPDVDVIIIARGGGSVQDLAAFDDEQLCRAIRAVGIPVVTAVGHTENNPVCNHITHSAFVPRHAADVTVPDRRDLLRDIGDATDSMRRAAADIRGRAELFRTMSASLTVNGRLTAFNAGLLHSAAVLAASAENHVRDSEQLLSGFNQTANHRIEALRATASAVTHDLGLFGAAANMARTLSRRTTADLDNAAAGLSAATSRLLKGRRENLTRALERMTSEQARGARRHLSAQLKGTDISGASLTREFERHARQAKQETEALSGVLAAADFRRRGWLLATDHHGHGISRADQLATGERVRLHLHGGDAGAVISDIHRNESDT